MARHEVVIHENTGALRETAPYIGSYISKEQVVMAEFAEAVGAKCGLPPIQVIAIIGGAFEAISALERDALVRVRTDIGVVCGVITGSFPTADADFDPSRNALELALRLDDTLRLDLADTVPTIVTDANLTKLRVDNVMDLAEQKPMNLIHGQNPFRVAGFNMVLSDEGATTFLQNGLGTTFALVIDRVVTHQLFEAHTAELLPPGDYKLVVKSRAGDAAGPLQTSFRRVKYMRVVGPEPVPIDQSSDGVLKIMSVEDGGQSETFTAGDDWAILGEGFKDSAPGWQIAAVSVDAGAGGTAIGLNISSATATECVVSMDPVDVPEAGDYPAAKLIVEISRPGGEGAVTETLEAPINMVVE